MSKSFINVLRVVCIIIIAPMLLLVYAGCHEKAGDESVSAGNFEFGGGVSIGGTGTGGGATTSGAAGVPTVELKLVKLDASEMEVLDFPFTPLMLSIKAAFSEAMNTAEVEKATALVDPNANKVDGDFTWSADKLTMTFKPKARLAPKTKYSLKIAKEAVSESGGAIEPVDKSFTTMTLGDVNGDGMPDFVAGAPSAAANKGTAYVYGGDVPSGGKAIAKIDGTVAGGLFGRSVSIAGDLNADGYADVVIGAPQENNLLGTIYCFSGKKLVQGDTDSSKADAAIHGPAAKVNGYFGGSIAGIGDINADGYADILVGAPGTDNDVGAVYALDGKKVMSSASADADQVALSVISGQGKYRFGQAIAFAGDVDGDKVPEIIAGAPGYPADEGWVYFFSTAILNANHTVGDALVKIAGGGGCGSCFRRSCSGHRRFQRRRF